jgi:hypothetical protein
MCSEIKKQDIHAPAEGLGDDEGEEIQIGGKVVGMRKAAPTLVTQ